MFSVVVITIAVFAIVTVGGNIIRLPNGDICDGIVCSGSTICARRIDNKNDIGCIDVVNITDNKLLRYQFLPSPIESIVSITPPFDWAQVKLYILMSQQRSWNNFTRYRVVNDDFVININNLEGSALALIEQTKQQVILFALQSKSTSSQTTSTTLPTLSTTPGITSTQHITSTLPTRASTTKIKTSTRFQSTHHPYSLPNHNILYYSIPPTIILLIIISVVIYIARRYYCKNNEVVENEDDFEILEMTDVLTVGVGDMDASFVNPVFDHEFEVIPLQ